MMMKVFVAAIEAALEEWKENGSLNQEELGGETLDADYQVIFFESLIFIF